MKNLDKKLAKYTKKVKGSKKLTIAIILALVLAAGFYFKSLFVAATVDGTPITRVALVKELESQSGQETLDSLITRQLVYQEAEKQGIEITDVVIEQEIERLRGVVEAQGTTLDNALALQGQTEESLKRNIRFQKTIEELLKEDVEVTDEEAREFYEQNKDLYEEGAQYEDLEEDIKEQLRQQGLQQEFQGLIQRLREEANINYFVEF